MLSYFLKFRKKKKSRNSKVARTKIGRIMLLSKCGVCDSKKSISFKDLVASGLLSNLLGFNTLLSEIPILGPILG